MAVDNHSGWLTMPGSEALIRVFWNEPAMLPTGEIAENSPDRVATRIMPGIESVLAVSNGSRLVGWSPIERGIAIIDPAQMQSMGDIVFSSGVGMFPTVVYSTPSTLAGPLVEGRNLFVSASDTAMSQGSSGVSCETCHADQTSDGFTWEFEDFPRQTPSLAGMVSNTLPITWTGEVGTVIEEIHATSTQRMGGTGLDDVRAARVAAWVNYTRLPVRPELNAARAAAVERGRAVFHDETVGCANCHSGEAYVDGESWKVADFDMRTNTPTLLGIAASAPYFHDGSADTLREVVERSRDGSMGNTRDLSERQMDDLVAYLESL